jgi:hypothetical protein
MQIQNEPDPIPDYTKLFKKTSAYEKFKEPLSKKLAAIFEEHADNSCLEQDVKGNEVIITGALRGRINDSLKAIAQSINRMRIDGISLQSTTFLQKEEGKCGSDFVITFELFEKNKPYDPVVSKSTLIQAKTAIIREGPPKKLYCANPDLAGQLKTLESVSSGKGYLMFYTDAGAFVVPAAVANEKISNTVLNLDFTSVSKSGDVVKKMAICTGGDVDLSPKKLGASRKPDGRVNASEFAKLIATHTTEMSDAKIAPPQNVLTISVDIK